MLERDITAKIKTYIKYVGGTCHKYHGGPYAEKGVSDLFGTLPGGRAFYFEVKLPGKKANAMQKLFLEEEAKRGAIVGVVTSVEDVERHIHMQL